MSNIVYNEDSNDHLAEQSKEIFPEDLAITSGSAEDEADDAATTQTSGFNRTRAGKRGVALLALAAVIFSAVIFGTSRPGKGTNSIADSIEIAKAIEFEPTYKPTLNNAALSNDSIQIEFEPTFKPTLNHAALSKSAPTEAKAAKQPAIIPPTPSPTAKASLQATETVSTETTGPPTVAGRETRV